MSQQTPNTSPRRTSRPPESVFTPRVVWGGSCALPFHFHPSPAQSCSPSYFPFVSLSARPSAQSSRIVSNPPSRQTSISGLPCDRRNRRCGGLSCVSPVLLRSKRRIPCERGREDAIPSPPLPVLAPSLRHQTNYLHKIICEVRRRGPDRPRNDPAALDDVILSLGLQEPVPRDQKARRRARAGRWEDKRAHPRGERGPDGHQTAEFGLSGRSCWSRRSLRS